MNQTPPAENQAGNGQKSQMDAQFQANMKDMQTALKVLINDSEAVKRYMREVVPINSPGQPVQQAPSPGIMMSPPGVAMPPWYMPYPMMNPFYSPWQQQQEIVDPALSIPKSEVDKIIVRENEWLTFLADRNTSGDVNLGLYIKARQFYCTARDDKDIGATEAKSVFDCYRSPAMPKIKNRLEEIRARKTQQPATGVQPSSPAGAGGQFKSRQEWASQQQCFKCHGMGHVSNDPVCPKFKATNGSNFSETKPNPQAQEGSGKYTFKAIR